jgi:hypothetical protein
MKKPLAIIVIVVISGLLTIVISPPDPVSILMFWFLISAIAIGSFFAGIIQKRD